MKRIANGLALLVILAILNGAPLNAKPPKKPENKVVGTIWSFTAKKQGDPASEEITGQYRVHEYVIYKGDKKVGEIKPSSPTETTLTFTDFPQLNGVAKLTKVGQKPSVWKGTLDHTDGTKWHLNVTVKQK